MAAVKIEEPPPGWAKRSLADRAAGFITCFCLSWPDVRFWKLKRKSESYWAASCPNGCGGPHPVTGASRDAIKATWNERHRRWT